MPPRVPFDPVSYLEANAAEWPDRPAVIDEQRTLTFGELAERVHAAAAALGDRRRQVVAVCLPNVWQYVVLELAIPLAGGVIMPLAPSLGSYERARAMQRSGATLTATAGLAEGPFRGRVTAPRPDAARVVEIALTSGTTGMPKLASLTAGLKQATYEGFTSRLEVTRDDRVLIMSPLTQGIGGMCLYCLRRGAALVMAREPRFTPGHTLRLAEKTGATLLAGVPTNVIRMLDSPELPGSDLSHARCTAVAGAPMPAEVARAWEERTGSKLCIFYGSMDAGQLAVGSPSDPQEKRWTTAGRVHDCAECMITADGEICMRGPTVQERYWGEDHGPYSDDGWAHMGDLGHLDAEGYLHVTGRLKDIVIRGGSNINPYEVEDALRSHVDVADVCVVGRPDHELGERVQAFVVARRPVGVDDLGRHLQRVGLARYKWPEYVERLDEIPLKGPGKVDRAALRALAGAG